MNQDKKELNEVQQYALKSAFQEAENKKLQLSRISGQIFKELGIQKEDLQSWRFQEDFSYVEKTREKKDK